MSVCSIHFLFAFSKLGHLPIQPVCSRVPWLMWFSRHWPSRHASSYTCFYVPGLFLFLLYTFTGVNIALWIANPATMVCYPPCLCAILPILYMCYIAHTIHVVYYTHSMCGILPILYVWYIAHTVCMAYFPYYT